MGKVYKTGIVISGTADSGIKAVALTRKELEALNKTQKKNASTQKKSRKETDDNSKSMSAYAGKLGLVTTAASALTAVIGGMSLASTVQETVALTRETNAWANAVGVSAQELQASGYAAESLGLTQSKMGDIYKDLTERMGEMALNGGGPAVEMMEHLNLKIEDLVAMSPDQQLMAIAGGLDQVGEQANKIQILESLASDASLLIPLLDNSGEKFKQLKQEAIDSGLAMSAIDTAKITLLDVEFRKLSASSDGFGNGLTAGLAPAVYGVTKEINALTLGWGSAGDMTALALDITVTGLGYVLDAGHEVLTTVKLIEIGWLHVGNVGVSAFIGLGNVGVDFVNNFLQPFRISLSAIIEGWGYLIQAAGDFTGNVAWQKAGDFMLGYSESIKDTRFELNDFVELQKDLQVQIAESNNELLDLLNAKAPSSEIKEWLAEQREEVEKLAAANVAAAESKKKSNAESAAQQKKDAELAKELATGVGQVYKDTASSIRGSFSGAFRDALDGQNSFADRMKSTFKDMLADMATMAVARPVIIPLTSGIGSMLGVPDDAIAKNAEQLGGTAGDTTGWMADAGEVIGAGMMGYMAGGMAAKMFDVANPGMAQNLTAVGTMIAGPIGGAVGFAVGSLFGGDWVTESAKLNLDYVRGLGVSGTQEIYQARDGGLLSSDDNKVISSAIDAQLSQRLSATFDQFEYDLSAQLKLLGIGNLAGLNGFTSSATLDVTGLDSDQVNEAITQWTGDVTVEMAAAMLPGMDSFRRVGEEGVETIERLTESLGLMYALGRNLDITIASLIAGDNAAAQFGIQIEYATADIIATADRLANTTDMQTRIELEQQYADQVIARYQLEQEMLGSLQQAVLAIGSDIEDLRLSISGDIAGIVGAEPRGVSAITSDLLGITAGAAPDSSLYVSLQGQLDTAEAQSVGIQSDIGVLSGQLSTLQTERGDFEIELTALADAKINEIQSLSFAEYFDGTVDRLVAEFNDLGAELNSGLLEFDAQITSITDSLSLLQGEHSGLLEVIASLQTQADTALTDYNASMTDYLSLTGDQVDQLQGLREETLNYYNAMLQLDTAMTGMAATIGDTLESLRLDALSPAARLDDLQAQFTGLVSDAGGATGYDLVSIADQLNALVNPLLTEAETLYASGQGYQDIYDMITLSLGDIEQRLITEAPEGYEESSINLLTSIDGLLGDMQDVLSAAEQAIIDAIDTSRLHTVATLEDIRLLLGGEGRTLSSFDTGTSYVPRDMQANIHQGEIIFDPRSSEILRNYGIQVQGGPDPKVVEILNRIERALVDGSGDLHLKFVTSDGKQLKEEVIRDIGKRSKRGEAVVHVNGVVS